MALWDHSLQVNLLGVQAFTPLLKAQRNSQIVNVASLAGLIPATGQSAYCAAKTALVAFSECLGRELASSGISTSVVCPYYFRDSNIGDSLTGEDPRMEAYVRQAASTAKQNAEEVADIVIRGMDARKPLILTDPEGHVLWRAKRFATPVYKWLLDKAAARGNVKTPVASAA